MSTIISDAIELFLAQKEPATRRMYRSVYQDFEEFCRCEMANATRMDALKYFEALKKRPGQDGQPVGGATIRLYYQALSKVFRFLLDMELITKNPIAPVAHAISWRQLAEKRPTASLPFGTPRKLIRAFSENNKRDIRDRGGLAILFGAGLRRSELISLNVGSIKLSPENIVYIELPHTKSGKNEVRTLARFAWKYVRKLITQRNGEGATNDDPLLVFYYADGKPRGRLNVKTLYLMFCKACKKIGLKAAPHAARAAFASKLWHDTQSDLLVADALGHAGVKQIRKYVKNREKIGMKKISGLDYDL